MDRPGVRQVPEGSRNRGKMEKTGYRIICGAPTTLAVKGLMMMMTMMTPKLLTLWGTVWEVKWCVSDENGPISRRRGSLYSICKPVFFCCFFLSSAWLINFCYYCTETFAFFFFSFFFLLIFFFFLFWSEVCEPTVTPTQMWFAVFFLVLVNPSVVSCCVVIVLLTHRSSVSRHLYVALCLVNKCVLRQLITSTLFDAFSAIFICLCTLYSSNSARPLNTYCVLLLSVFVSTGTVPLLLRGGPVSYPRDECLCQYLTVDLSCSSVVRCVHSHTTYKEIRVHFPDSVSHWTILKEGNNRIITIQ